MGLTNYILIRVKEENEKGKVKRVWEENGKRNELEKKITKSSLHLTVIPLNNKDNNNLVSIISIFMSLPNIHDGRQNNNNNKTCGD